MLNNRNLLSKGGRVRKKGVVLAIVIGILIVIFTLALVAIHLMTQEARVAEHKIRRMRAVFAARAGMVHALEMIRQGQNPNGTSINIGAGVAGYPAGGLAVNFVYNPASVAGPMGTAPLNVTVNY
jgi:Tfp pilus assembly protein PilX